MKKRTSLESLLAYAIVGVISLVSFLVALIIITGLMQVFFWLVGLK